MFVDRISSLKNQEKEFLEINKKATQKELDEVILKIESNEKLDWRDLAVLLSEVSLKKENLGYLVQLAYNKTIERFGKVIKFYVPLYLSNYCINSCLYCSFAAVNKINRKVLTIEEAKLELEAIKKMGFKHILLVAGEDPTNINVNYLSEIISVAKNELGIASVSIEVSPFEENEYKKLVKSGLDGLTLYQETYHKDTYLEVHRGRKRNYEKRLIYPEYAAKAGIRKFNFGVLLGLYDHIIESFYLYHHVKYFEKNYWQVHLGVNFPRIRPMYGGFKPKYPVSDKELVRMIVAFRLMFEDIDLVLSTRESAEFRDFMLGIGITQISAGSKTYVGGYFKNYAKVEEDIGQFEIADTRTVKEVENAVKNKGFEVVWKDWQEVMFG